MTGASTIAVAASAAPLGLSQGGEVPSRIKLLSYRDVFYCRDGRGPYKLEGRDHAEQVIAATVAWQSGADPMIDYDHQSVYAAVEGVGGTAPAAGWIKNLVAEADGIYADVEWTVAASAALKAREYRYISPFFKVDAASRKVTRIVNVGLTNSPALDLPAIASADFTQDGEHDVTKMISIAVLASALSLAATATEDDVLASINGLKADKEKADAALAGVRAGLGLDANAKLEELPVAASSIHARAEAGIDATKYVPKASFDELHGKLAKINEERVVAAVEAGVAEGKILPSLKDWVIEQAAGDLSVVASYVEKAVAFDGDKKAVEGKSGGSAADKLTDEENALCSSMGWDREEFAAQKAKEAE